MQALLIVDVQNDFLPGGALPVLKGDQIIPVVNKLQNKFEIILASKDWHPKDHVSFAKTHQKEPGTRIFIQGFEQHLWPVHCVQDTPGADFPKELKTNKIRKVFYKGSDPEIDSYSAFFDNARLRSTGLDTYLKERHINELYVVGLATDFCVKYSVLDALDLGLQVSVIEDACRGIDVQKGDSQRALDAMKKQGARIMKSEDFQ